MTHTEVALRTPPQITPVRLLRGRRVEAQPGGVGYRVVDGEAPASIILAAPRIRYPWRSARSGCAARPEASAISQFAPSTVGSDRQRRQRAALRLPRLAEQIQIGASLETVAARENTGLEEGTGLYTFSHNAEAERAWLTRTRPTGRATLTRWPATATTASTSSSACRRRTLIPSTPSPSTSWPRKSLDSREGRHARGAGT